MLVALGMRGSGKSRLVAELGTRPGRTGALVLVGECVELAEGELAFSPIIPALRGVMFEDAAGVGGVGRSAAGGAGRTVAGAGSRRGAPPAVVRGRVPFLLDWPAPPVLLVVEDVHWVDRACAIYFGFLVPNARRDALVLAIFWPDELLAVIR